MMTVVLSKLGSISSIFWVASPADLSCGYERIENFNEIVIGKLALVSVIDFFLIKKKKLI